MLPHSIPLNHFLVLFSQLMLTGTVFSGERVFKRWWFYQCQCGHAIHGPFDLHPALVHQCINFGIESDHRLRTFLRHWSWL